MPMRPSPESRMEGREKAKKKPFDGRDPQARGAAVSLVDMRSISRRMCMPAEDGPHVRDSICFFFEIVWGCRQPVYRVLLTIETVERAVLEQPVAIKDHNHGGLVPGSSCDI